MSTMSELEHNKRAGLSRVDECVNRMEKLKVIVPHLRIYFHDGECHVLRTIGNGGEGVEPVCEEPIDIEPAEIQMHPAKHILVGWDDVCLTCAGMASLKLWTTELPSHLTEGVEGI